MSPSLRALLVGAIDYAGLFPPARLPLEEAFRNHLEYRATPESWMLGRFICPLNLLEELLSFVEEIERAGSPVTLSVLGQGGSNAGDFLENFRADLAAIEAFKEKIGSHFVVDTIETRLPDDLEHCTQSDGAVVAAAADLIESRALPLTPYYECRLPSKWESTLECAIGQIALANRQASQSNRYCRPAGFKLRCGGIEAKAFPPADQVAFAISKCCEMGVPFKFTAGLHHPLRHFDAQLQTTMHGFLNVLAAGVVADAIQGKKEESIRQIILDEKSEDFRFDNDGLRWQQHFVSLAKIVQARTRLVKSFGSCSFDEPREDLRALGLL